MTVFLLPVSQAYPLWEMKDSPNVEDIYIPMKIQTIHFKASRNDLLIIGCHGLFRMTLFSIGEEISS